MKAVQTKLPECFEWYREQIAGHHPSVFKNGQYEIGFIKERGSPNLLKPVQEGIRGEREVSLYTELNNLRNVLSDEREKLLAEFATFLPKYHGLQRVTVGEKTIDCLIMEDLTEGYKQPCTMDIKMGKVTYDPDAPPEKILSETVKYPAQTLLGFRLLGYRMHCHGNGASPAIQNKRWGRTRTLENIVAELLNSVSQQKIGQLRESCRTSEVYTDWRRVKQINTFLVCEKTWHQAVKHGICKKENVEHILFFVSAMLSAYGEFLSGRPNEELTLAKAVLSQLYAIQKWFHTQRVYHFYASSILMVYEACPQLKPNVVVKLIDFSHVFSANGELDENYIFGVDSVVRCIEEFCKQIQLKN